MRSHRSSIIYDKKKHLCGMPRRALPPPIEWSMGRPVRDRMSHVQTGIMGT